MAALLRAALAVALTAACGGSTDSVVPRAGGASLPAVPSGGSSSTAPPLPARSVAPSATASPSSARPPRPATRPPAPDVPPVRDPNQRYEVSVTILESAQHGPQLCAGGVATSLPPQCGGPDVRPWSWDDVEGEESSGGTTWGEFRIVGTFDGKVFHVTERPGPPRREPTGSAEPFEPGCPEPPGGWRVSDREKVSDEDHAAAVSYANGEPDVAAVWIAYLDDGPPGEDVPMSATVLTLAFTGDLDRHRRAARALWGGPLCVTRMPRAKSALERKQRAFMDDRTAAAAAAGVYVYGSAIDEVGNVVRGTVLIADAAARYWVDKRYGPGWIELDGVFRPVR